MIMQSLRDILFGNLAGIGVFFADYAMERLISNMVNRRIAMYIFHMMFALPIFIKMRHSARTELVDFQRESQSDTVSYIMSFFSVGLGLYFSYVVRNYFTEVTNGRSE